MYDMSRWYIRLGNWCFNIVLLNILWFLSTVSGLFIFGLFPATAALFAVVKTMIMEEENPPIIKLFFKRFKSEFLMSNALGYLFMVIGSLLYINLRIIQLLENNFMQLTLASVTIVIAIIYSLTLLYVFPIFVHFDFKVLQYPIHALVLAVAKPFHTVFLLIILAIIGLVFFNIPELILLFGLSSVCFIIMKVASLSFPRKYLVE